MGESNLDQTQLVDSLKKQLQQQQAAVEQYLTYRGHDLCHERRAELARAFSLPADLASIDRQVTFEEFCDGCELYQRQLFGCSERRIAKKRLYSILWFASLFVLVLLGLCCWFSVV